MSTGGLPRLAVVKAIAVLAVLGIFGASCSSDESSTSNGTELEGEQREGDGTEDVSDRQVIRIGFAYPDLSGVRVLNEEASIGFPEEQANAVVNRWRTEDLLPDGIDVELVFVQYPVIGSDGKVAVCTKLAQDEEVFAVLGFTQFRPGAECLIDRFDIPVIEAQPGDDALYNRNGKFFSIMPSFESYYRTYAQWLIKSGRLEGKTIGVSYETPRGAGFLALQEELEAAGFEISSVTSSSGEGISGPTDTLSFDRFKEDGVDFVIPIVGSTATTIGLSHAVDQNYFPEIAAVGDGTLMSDLVGKQMPDEIFAGVRGLAPTRVGELGSGVENPAMEACVSNFEDFTGDVVPRSGPEAGRVINILQTCDALEILRAGLAGLDDEMSHESFVAGIENAGEFEFVSTGNGSFSATDHAGGGALREVFWNAEEDLWQPVGDLIEIDE